MTCVVCDEGDGSDVPASLGGLTVPFLCGECRVAANEARPRGKSFDLTRSGERKEFLKFRAEILAENAEPSTEGVA